MATPTVLSTFTGAGGLDLGLEAAGFEAVGCVEWDSTARRSLKANRDWRLLEPHDISLLALSLRPSDLGLRPGELTLLAGAPPCQPYSKAAQWAPMAWGGLSDSRATPLFDFLTLAERFLPEAILIENVPGFLSGPKSAIHVIESFVAEVNSATGTDYLVSYDVLNAADYGVAQVRNRAIVLIVRDGREPIWPDRTHVDEPLTAWDALHDLPREAELPRAQGKWADLLPSIPEGRNYLWHTDRGEGRPLFGYRTRYWSFLLKLAKNQPSWTLPAQPGPAVGPFHWDDRPLTVREMLRLQSFPADWVIEGARREQVMQIGNATPPLLGETLGRAVRQSLEHDLDDLPMEPRLAISRAQNQPRPKKPKPVPQKYLALQGRHPDHPGTGRGPSPRPSL